MKEMSIDEVNKKKSELDEMKNIPTISAFFCSNPIKTFEADVNDIISDYNTQLKKFKDYKYFYCDVYIYLKDAFDNNKKLYETATGEINSHNYSNIVVEDQSIASNLAVEASNSFGSAHEEINSQVSTDLQLAYDKADGDLSKIQEALITDANKIDDYCTDISKTIADLQNDGTKIEPDGYYKKIDENEDNESKNNSGTVFSGKYYNCDNSYLSLITNKKKQIDKLQEIVNQAIAFNYNYQYQDQENKSTVSMTSTDDVITSTDSAIVGDNSRIGAGVIGAVVGSTAAILASGGALAPVVIGALAGAGLGLATDNVWDYLDKNVSQVDQTKIYDAIGGAVIAAGATGLILASGGALAPVVIGAFSAGAGVIGAGLGYAIGDLSS